MQPNDEDTELSSPNVSRRRLTRWTSASVALLMLLLLPQASHAYRRPGRTEIVSLDSDGAQVKTPVGTFLDLVDISDNGRYIAFTSNASDLVPADTNRTSDVFVRDRVTGKTERVSVGHLGQQGVGVSPNDPVRQAGAPSISGDGRFVAFMSFGTNLVQRDSNLQADIFVRDRLKEKTVRVSVASDGSEALPGGDIPPIGLSHSPSISSNGRLVSFTSAAINLSEDDSNGAANDVFVHDLRTGKTELISNLAPTDGPGVLPQELTSFTATQAECSSLSGNGRFVAYSVEPDGATLNSDRVHAYVYDRRKGKTELLSVATDGEPSRFHTWAGWILSRSTWTCGPYLTPLSADGRYVAFASEAHDIVPNDTNDGLDVFVRDRKTDRTERISTISSGGEANGDSIPTSMTPDGRYVVFTSDSWNLDPTEPEGRPEGLCTICPGRGFEFAGHMDVFVHDRVLGITDLVSIAKDGTSTDPVSEDDQVLYGGGQASVGGAITSDGRQIAFESTAPDLVRKDANGGTSNNEPPVCIAVINQGGCWREDGIGKDVFVRERGLDLGARVVDATDAVTKSLPRAADLLSVSIADRPTLDDIFLRIQLADLPATAPHLTNALLRYGFEFTANQMSYEVRAQASRIAYTGVTKPVETSGRFRLFRCAGSTCQKISELEGGYGTMGKEIVFSIPSSALHVGSARELGYERVFTSQGSKILDKVMLSTRRGIARDRQALWSELI